MKILIATDGSAHSTTMLKCYAKRTFHTNDEVRMVAAYEYPTYLLNPDPMIGLSNMAAEATDYAQKSAEEATDHAIAIFTKAHPLLSVSKSAIEGSPKSVILEEAHKWGADLIVVGSHVHGALEGFFLGSVSEAVAGQAKCSVEIVRP